MQATRLFYKFPTIGSLQAKERKENMIERQTLVRRLEELKQEFLDIVTRLCCRPEKYISTNALKILYIKLNCFLDHFLTNI